MAGRCYYVTWVDRTDPWPRSDRIRPGGSEIELDGQRFQCLPANHPQWPGVPMVEQAAAVVVGDPRMGRLVSPGMTLSLDGRPCRITTGPILSALFHPGSRFHDLEGLDAVYLLTQTERIEEVRERLAEVLQGICQARRIAGGHKRIQFVGVEGVADPTDHSAIVAGVKEWLEDDDPFVLRRRDSAREPPRIVVNLSGGTAAMHAAWLMLRWNGALGGAASIVEFVQGDGGLDERVVDDSSPSSPLRVVPIDTLSHLIGRKGPGPQPSPGLKGPRIGLDELRVPPFDDLRRRIAHAAMLGLPILLQGERGTGKTVLAQYYHEMRKDYQSKRARGEEKTQTPVKRGEAARMPGKSGEKETSSKVGERYPENTGKSNFVGVTLSEYADIDTLRDTLFGWVKGAFTGAEKAFDGLLGEAHLGTLFLDEVHHLARPLQAALLGPLNDHRYRPKMATFEVVSQFDLVVATNDPHWRQKMADDFRDRIERIVLEVPAFRTFQRHGADLIWRFWEFTLAQRCTECGIECSPDGVGWEECREQLMGLFRRHPLPGNWRDLKRLADNLLLHLTDPGDGRPTPVSWDRVKLEHAIAETFDDS
jgi:hypothetical protein